MGKVGKITAIWLALCLIVPFSLFLTVPADAAKGSAAKAYAKLASDVDEEVIYRRSAVLDDFTDASPWSGTEYVRDLAKSKSGGTRCVLAMADTETRKTLGVSRELDTETDGMNELMFAFLILGSPSDEYTLSISLGTDGGERTYTAEMRSNDWYDVFCDISGASSVISVSVTANGIGAEAYVSSVALSSLSLGDTSHSEWAEKYSAIHIEGGTVTDGGIAATPEDGSVRLSGDALLPAGQKNASSTVLMKITVEGISYAQLGASVSAEPVWKVTAPTEASSATVTSDQDTYVLCFTTDSRIVSWTLSFDGVTLENGAESFTVRRISILTGGESTEGYPLDTSLGKIQKCVYSYADGGVSVSVTGSLTRDAAVAYMDGEICLYMIPVWKKIPSALEEEPSAVLEMSTEFGFSVSLEDYPQAGACLFAVALRNDDGTVCVAPPCFPSPSPMSKVQLPKVIVSSDSKSDVFTSGVGGVIIDVDLSKLVQPAALQSGRLVAWGDSYIYLNEAMLANISSEVEFYSACSVSVFFRFRLTSDIFACSVGTLGTGYAFDISSKYGADILAAVTDHLSSRFSPAGFILGDSLNIMKKCSSTDFADMFVHMKRQAAAARLIFSVASARDASTVVILPFESLGDTEEDISSRAKTHSAVSSVALSDFYFAEAKASVRWASLTSAAQDGSAGDNPSASAAQSGSAYLGSALAVTGSAGEDMTMTYGDLVSRFPASLFYCISLEKNGVFVPLTLSEPSVEMNEMPYTAGDKYRGSYTVWDFTKSFSASSWLISSGEKPVTEANAALSAVSELSSCRALMLNMRSDTDQSVVATGKMAKRLDLTDCDGVEFVLVADGGEAETEFTVCIGDHETRYVYPVKVRSGVPVSVMCTLDGDISPTYISVVTDASDEVEIGIASVRAYSRELDGAELEKSVLHTSEGTDAGKKAEAKSYTAVVIAVIAVVSVSAFVMLSRRNIKE